MFNKLVAIEPIGLVPEALEKLNEYAKEVVLYSDRPENDEEIIRRIGDADAVLVRHTTAVDRYVIENGPNIKYIGMCCSLYSEESANVDIPAARERGIQVLGIRDYGDRGVVEYVLYELIRILHGYDGLRWKELPEEITGLQVGIVGLGVTGTLIAEAIQFMGADVRYYSRTRKTEQERRGIEYRELSDLLRESEVVFTCLNKNVILLHEEEFRQLGKKKILFNTSIGPSHDIDALRSWLEWGDGYFVCDTAGALGDASGELLTKPNVICKNQSAGWSRQSGILLSKKVLANIEKFLDGLQQY